MAQQTKKEAVTSFLVDIREASELLLSGRPPKQVSYLKKVPFPAKLRSLLNASQSKLAPNAKGGEWSEFGKTLLRGGTAVAVNAGASAVLRQIVTPLEKPVSNLRMLASYVTLGANIVEETNALRLRLPAKDGPSIDASQAALNLTETAAKHVIKSLVVGVPIASGIPTVVAKVFKNLASLGKSPRVFKGREHVQSSATTAQAVPVTSPTAVLPAQCGLLQDEIAYRLTLLAENVYEPIAAYVAQQKLPSLVILEAFRADNTGTSPHERGEAIDLTLGNTGSSLDQAENLYKLAVWCRDHILYDQLILCYGEVGGGQAWLHVTFTPNTLRRQVYTKPFHDAHVEGLFQYGQYADNALRDRDLEQAKEAQKVSQDFLGIMAARDSKTNPIPLTTNPFASISGTAAGIPGTSTGVPGTDPQAQPYAPNNGSQELVLQIVGEMLSIPEWRSLVGVAGHTSDFLHEVVRRCYERGAAQSGVGAIGLNGQSGNPDDTSVDTIAILNPTGGPGFGSWSSSRRVQLVRVLMWSTTAEVAAGWNDITAESLAGGGFIPLDGVADTTPDGVFGYPTAEEIAVLVRKFFAEEPKQTRPRSEWEVDWASYGPDGPGGDFSQTPLLREEYQRAFRVTFKTAQALSVRYPQIGVASPGSGTDSVDYPGFPRPRYRHKMLVLSKQGPIIDIMSGLGPDPDYGLDAEWGQDQPGFWEAQWSDPFTGAGG